MRIRFKKNLYFLAANFIVSIKSFDQENTILIFSDPRGGSTWITEIIANLKKTAIIWEPLHPENINIFNKLGFNSRQHIPDSAFWPEAENAFKLLFGGKILGPNSFVLSSPVDFIFARQLIIKICRGNAMLPWITKIFNFQYQPIYLVRHPLAVVASQLRHGAWNSKSKPFTFESSPYNEYYSLQKDFLSSLHSPEEQLVAVWCLTNHVSLTNRRNNKDWITIFYEDLLTNPDKELKRIFDRWKINMPDSIIEKVNKQSITTKKEQFEQETFAQIGKWEKFFTQSQLIKITAIMQYFNVQHYSCNSFHPIR